MRVGGLIGLHFVCTFFGTETASEIAAPGLKQFFGFLQYTLVL